MPKDNLIFKLDNLEYQYNYLNGTLENFQPRLNGTSKAYNAKGKKSSKRISKLLEEIKIGEVEKQLNELCTDIFQKKTFHLDGKLRQFIEKQLSQYKPSKKSKNDFTPVIKDIREKYGLEKFSELISKSKVIKLSLSKINPTREPPKWFTEHEFWKIHNDKNNEYNPSKIWNEVVMKTEGCNQLLSSLMNNNKCKELIAGFNSGMDVFLNINKGKKDKSKEDKVSQSEKETQKTQKEGDNQESPDEKEEQDDDGDESDESSESQLQDEGENGELDEEVLKQYDDMLAASDEEDNEGLQLDPNINYNEVTDEEPSDDEKESEDEDEDENEDEDEDDGEPETKKPKYQLPELMGGYYSGGDSSDDDLKNDRIAQEQMPNKGQRKNRRGQRARRKIWEQKFGEKANHVVKERNVYFEKKRKKQQEFEEREAKRAAKAAKASEFEKKASQEYEKGAARKTESKPKNETPAAEHPSWIAKREAEAKLKNAKFEGKKVVFD
ncbi:hypothetical protein ZYGR_0P02400 [Zygosaccharomyces rouxii]|uniref:Bud22 domain-containing protein n=1 Tax=Zygosaccharomyces rouxii TaxID=4956 RepID=A0A1Q3A1J1_ZYGRO|nr:hypothetical protein ZYGR_0P02400 [Zygosaccharomyces rouxii]